MQATYYRGTLAHSSSALANLLHSLQTILGTLGALAMLGMCYLYGTL